jgi:hypothetical protein
MMVIVKALKINEFYFNDITGDLEALIWILLGSELPDWATFTAQFDSLQKREKSKLQAVATEIQNEARDRASKSITREISGDVEESATPPRKSKGSVRAQSSEESE